MQQKKSNNHLIPRLTLASSFLIIIANTVGSGIFTTSGFIMEDVQNPSAMLLCWFLGGMLALTGALCYGELGAMFPAAGGDYVFLRESFGKRVAFLSGWVSLWVGFSAPIAAVAIASGKYITTALPETLQQSGLPSILAVSVIVFFTWAHTQGLAFGSWIQNVITFAKILLILLLVCLGLAWGKGSLQHFAGPLRSSDVFSAPFATSLIFVSFAYSGWNACVYLGSEIKNAGRTIPASIVTATLCLIVMYLLVNIVYIYAVHPEKMYGVVEIGSLAVSNLFGVRAGSLFGIVVAFCLLSAVSSMIMIGPRVYYAMAQDKLFLALFRKVNHTSHVPTYAIMLQGGISIVFVLTSTFDLLLMYVGFVLAIFSSLTVLGMMVLRSKAPDIPRPYRTWGYPLTPVIFMGGNLWIVIFSIQSNAGAFVWGLATIAAGWLVYEYYVGRLHHKPLLGKRRNKS